MKRFVLLSLLLTVFVLPLSAFAQPSQQRRPSFPFNGIAVDQTNLHLLSDAKTRSISPENFTGEKGKGAMATEGLGANAARELGQGWKLSPCVLIKGKETFTLGEIEGSGAIQQIWLTPAPLNKTRTMILRVYWDGEETPSIECPIADFFTCGWQEYVQNNSLMVTINPGSAFNCYWTMPFKKKAKLTIENLDDDGIVIFYQINYVLGDVPDNAAYFHAQFRRANRLKYKEDVTILDGVKGKGHFVGTYMAWEVFSPGWWGEGEIKFFMDGDKEFPTICGTGLEDYFCGSYGFHRGALYQEFSTPYAGLVQVIPNDIRDVVGQRFGLYRWHITDPVRFDQDLKVTMQALGWQSEGRYLPLEDDVSTVAFWYQSEPHAPFPKLPSKEELMIGPLKVKEEDLKK